MTEFYQLFRNESSSTLESISKQLICLSLFSTLMFQTAALRPAYQTPLSPHKQDQMICVSRPSPTPSQTAPLSRQMGHRKPWMGAHRIFRECTTAVVGVGGLLWPNTGSGVPASATSGDHDLPVASWLESCWGKETKYLVSNT